jgi:hypothetical protein
MIRPPAATVEPYCDLCGPPTPAAGAVLCGRCVRLEELVEGDIAGVVEILELCGVRREER